MHFFVPFKFRCVEVFFLIQSANDNDTQTTNVELTLRLKTLQEKFDQRTMELTQHVETHQKLCGRYASVLRFNETRDGGQYF